MMKNTFFCSFAVVMSFSSGPLQAALSWSSQLPESARTTKEIKGEGGHDHGGRRDSKPFFLQDSAGAEVQIWLPTLVRRPLQVNAQGVVDVAGTGVVNYHLLYARRKGEGIDEMALRYHYLNGKPTDMSPRHLLAYRKGALDVVPSPLTREHQRYLAGEAAEFIILFKNNPLANLPLTLTTSNGTSHELRSDAKGRVVVLLPDDFATVEAGRRANKPAEFVLTTHHSDTGTDYHTTLSADYHVNPSHWRSTAGALLAILVGFVGGLAVVRRSRKQEVKHV
jgi:hypothetical protein